MADEPKEGNGISRSALKIGAKLKGLTTENAALKKRAEAAEAQVTTLTTENGQLKAQVLTPDAKDKKIAELTGTIRSGKAKSVFSRLAKEAGAPEAAIEDLYTLSGHKAETDEPDEEAMKTLVADLKTKKPYAFAGQGDAGQGDAGGSGQGQGNPPPPPPGRDRGNSNSGGDGTILTREQLADPKFMLDKSNQELIQRAAREKRIRA